MTSDDPTRYRFLPDQPNVHRQVSPGESRLRLKVLDAVNSALDAMDRGDDCAETLGTLIARLNTALRAGTE